MMARLRMIFAVVALVTAIAARAEEPQTMTVVTTRTITVIDGIESVITESTDTIFPMDMNALAVPKVHAPLQSHFAWGVDVGSSIDMTGQDMTAIDLNACLGYRNRFIRFAGVGAGIRMMTSNSSRSYPVYALLRTSFSSKPSFLFLQIKAGMAFSNLYTDIYRRGFIGGAGMGFTLARGTDFASHIILSYDYMPLKRQAVDPMEMPLSDIHYASIRLGITF